MVNYKRGIFRLWAVVSVLWVCTFGYLTYSNKQCEVEFRGKAAHVMATATSASLVEIRDLTFDAFNSVANRCKEDADRYESFLWANPFLIALCYPIFIWVARGFKQDPTSVVAE